MQDAGPAAKAMLRRVFGADARSLALFRIALGSLILVDWTVRAPVLLRLYGAAGLFPRQFVDNANEGWSSLYFPYQLFDSSPAVIATAALSGIFAVALILGFRSRASTAGSWFLMASLHLRNPLATTYEGQILVLLLFFGIFVPLGACWSLDARAGRVARPPGYLVATGGTAAIFLQFVAIYFFTALHKSGPAWHAEGTALFYALSQNFMARPLASRFVSHPELMKFLTHIIYTWELWVGAAFLAPFWNAPLRVLAVASVWAFHTGLMLCLSLAQFPFFLMGGSLVFLPAGFWERVARVLPALGVRVRPAPTGPSAIGQRAASRSAVARRIWENVVPGVLIAYVVLQNFSSLPGGPALPTSVTWLGATLRLNQHWKMYAPEPSTTDHYYLMPGTLADGRQIDLLRDGQPLRLEPPASPPWIASPFPWGLYLEHTQAHRRELPLHDSLAAWQCRTWNSEHGGSDRLVTVEWLIHSFDLSGADEPQRTSLGIWDCAAAPGASTTRRAPVH